MSVDSTVRRSGSHGAGTWGSFRFYSLSVLHKKPDRSSCHCGSGSALNVLNVDRWSPWFSQLLTIFRAQKAHETASLASCTESILPVDAEYAIYRMTAPCDYLKKWHDNIAPGNSGNMMPTSNFSYYSFQAWVCSYSESDRTRQWLPSFETERKYALLSHNNK